MSNDEIKMYLSRPLIARISTVSPDGFPTVTPVWFLRHKEGVIIDAYRNSQKVRNIRHDSRVSVLIDSSETGLRVKGVLFSGRANLIEGLANSRIERAIFEKYLPKDLVANDPVALYYKSMGGTNPGDITLIELIPDKISSWDYTKVTVKDLDASSGRLTTRHRKEDIFAREG